MPGIAGLGDDEDKVDVLEGSESPGKPTRDVPATRIPSSDSRAIAREMPARLIRGREDFDKLIAWAESAAIGPFFDRPSLRRSAERRSPSGRHGVLM
jgi:hypothetical protein